ncbi:MAG: sugar ABC transporter ATP-binding protein [Christensenellales bacterium]
MLAELKEIVVDFGPVRAVDNVNFSVRPGEIHALLGENGAGKSTLMNVLAGTFPPDSGSIYVKGEPVRFSSAKSAMDKGIRLIHQELNLCNDLRVYENLYLAQEIKGKGGLLDSKQMIECAQRVFETMGANIDPKAPVSSLQTAEKQLVEIARALLFSCEIIIMDEPTTALSGRDIKNLFNIMRTLKARGVGFVYISHKMPEIFEVCDTFTVLRDGKWIADGNIADVNEKQISEMMTGKALLESDFASRKSNVQPEIALSVNNLNSDGIKDISFELKKGEILSVTGLHGSGRDQLADALFGVQSYTGEVIKDGKQIKGGIESHLKAGIAMVPRNRKERGILNDLSILDNLSMGFFNTKLKSLLISPKKERGRFRRRQQDLSIRADRPSNPITSLSGGNQQKVILGRWLEADADILLFDNPTQGIDVGTKYEIYKLMLSLSAQGKSIIMFSSEFAEIMKVSDRCIVMFRGEINRILNRDEISEESLMYYSTGAIIEEKQHA